MADTNILGDLSGLSNPFGTPSQGQWNLSRGVYTDPIANKQMTFFFETAQGEPFTQKTAIDQMSDAGGRRLAKYEYPYRDGQALADLGRKAEIFTLNIKFHGLNYQTKLAEFLDVVVNSGNRGTIIHPIRGTLNVRYRDHEFVHRYDEWNAVTIKAVFEEDNTDALARTNVPAASPDSALRTGLQALSNAQAQISSLIFSVSALLNLPAAISAAMKARLTSLTGQISRLLGQLGVTYSSSQSIANIALQSQILTGGSTALTSGQTTAGTLPPVYQVGFDAVTQALITSQIQAFVSANQITPQQSIFSANQARQAITAAINEINTNMGNDGYDIIILYRGLANTIQQAVQSSIAAAQSQVTLYTTPFGMSLRMVAKLNGLTPDDQNTIEMLNPYLPSVNYLPKGTVVTVPAA